MDTGDCVIKRPKLILDMGKMRIANTHGAFSKRMAMGLSEMLEELREGTEEVDMN